MGQALRAATISTVLGVTLGTLVGCGGGSGGGPDPAPPNQPPTAAFSATPSSGTAPLAVSFDAGASSDTDGTVAGYAWDFGDGTTDTGATTSHTYAAANTYTATCTVTDDDGATDSAQQTITVTGGVADTTPPSVTLTAPASGATLSGTVTLSADASDDTAVDRVEFLVDGTLAASDTTFPYSMDLVTTAYADGAVTLSAAAYDAAGNSTSDSVGVTLDNGTVIVPPDPVATELPATETTPFASATAFLYTGADPVQTGVAPGTIEEARAAVLRGKVLDSDGLPMGGVQVTVLSHPEFGQTLTRADGMFDLAVNGGGKLTVVYRRSGFLPLQRQITTPWQDSVWAPDVTMIAKAQTVTAIDLTSAEPIQAAQGDVVTDEDGSRRATLLVPQGTRAQIILEDGTRQPVDTLTMSFTEYTAGDSGRAAMPAALPPTSAYTYAFEISAAEAVAKENGKDVLLDQPVPIYIDNFIGFPVGIPVPVGYYDNDRGAWVPSDSGRILKVLGVTGGLADLDLDGDDTPDPDGALTALGITSAERQKLAELYAAGDTLWRIAVDHFSTYDCNWGWRYPDDAVRPGIPRLRKRPRNPCEREGSVIECQSRVLGESVAVAGTPFRLHYRSDRVPGYRQAWQQEIPLSGASVPASLMRIELQLEVAGRRFTHTAGATNTMTCADEGTRAWCSPWVPQIIEPLDNQSYLFTWDGLDAYGRRVQGVQPLTGRIGYSYAGGAGAGYQDTEVFGRIGTADVTRGGFMRGGVTVWQAWQGTIGLWDARGQGLGGWSLSVHHAYDPVNGELYRGDGRVRRAADAERVIDTVAGIGIPGPGNSGFSGDGGPARDAALRYPQGVAVASDGSLIIADSSNRRIRRVDPDGVIDTIAGNGGAGFGGDGGPATSAQLQPLGGVAVGPDGSIYVADYYNSRVRRIGTDGVIETVAGDGTFGYGGDGGPAVSATLNAPRDVAVAADGSVYVADEGNHRIRRIAVDGTIETVAGDGTYGYGGDGGRAQAARLASPGGVALGPQGDLYIADTYNHRVRRVTSGGRISTVAGDGTAGSDGDGGPATAAKLNQPLDVAVAANGTVYVADNLNRTVRRVAPDGTISTVAGDGTSLPDEFGDAGPATAASLTPFGLALDPAGNLYVADGTHSTVRRVGPILEATATGERNIASRDGRELYVFDSGGRHLRTVDADTGAIRFAFSYDAAGSLIAVEDGDGNQTAIERDAGGDPVAIVAPGGQRTQLTTDANGYLLSVSGPAGDTTDLSHDTDGLLVSLTTPEGGVHAYQYDTLGRLYEDRNPDNAYQRLFGSELADGSQVDVTTALNLTTSYTIETTAEETERATVTLPDGAFSTRELGADGSATLTLSNGTVISARRAPDPRWGMQAPLADEVVITTPGGLTQTRSQGRGVTFGGSGPSGLAVQTDTETVNGRTTTRVFDVAAGTLTTTTPEGRVSTTALDAQGRVTDQVVPGLYPVHNTYDAQGRLVEVTVGEGTDLRTTAVTYDADGNLDGITDPLLRSWTFEYDAAGRPTAQHLPGGRTVAFGYDADGNLTSLTPPARPAHSFTYSVAGAVSGYTPPPPTAGDPADPAVDYAYDLDGRLTLATRADDRTVAFAYDGSGRLDRVTIGEGTYQLAYDAGTGQLAAVTAPDGNRLGFTYDGGLLTGEQWTGGAVIGSVEYGYDADFRLSSVGINGGVPTAFAFDADGLLTGAGAMTLTRDAQHGLLAGTSLGGVSDTVTYDGFGEVTGYRAAFGTSDLFSVSYTRDAGGRITARTEAVEGGTPVTFAYTYDAAGRLETVAEDGLVTARYQYDANGNRTEFAPAAGGSVTAASYDDQDRLTAYGSTAYTYTAHGELQTATAGSQVTTYAYDALGGLRSVTLPDGTLVEYVIDGNGRRIGKKVGGTVVQGFLYGDENNPVAELDGSGTVVATFVYASRPDCPDYMEKGGTTYRILADHLGSPRLVVDVATGAVVQHLAYDAFGAVVSDDNPGFQPFGFGGGLYDRDTGLVRFGTRDYDPATGRWTTKDPIGFAGGDANLYAYVENDPVNWVDPLGLSRWYTYFDWLDPVGDAVAGFGDVVSFGFTRAVRRSAHIDGMIDPCSNAYFGGKVAGYVHAALSNAISVANWLRSARLARTLAAREVVRSRHAVYRAWKEAAAAAHRQAIRDGLSEAARIAKTQGLPSPASIVSLGAKVSGTLPSPASLVTPSLGGLRVTFAP